MRPRAAAPLGAHPPPPLGGLWSYTAGRTSPLVAFVFQHQCQGVVTTTSRKPEKELNVTIIWIIAALLIGLVGGFLGGQSRGARQRAKVDDRL